MPRITITERNRRLRAIKNQILKEPRQFQMDTYFDNVDSTGDGTVPHCGTAACIAGWALALFGKKKPQRPADLVSPCPFVPCDDGAARTLGLLRSETPILFFLRDWPGQFYERWWNCKTARGKARVAADRIEHFIQTGN